MLAKYFNTKIADLCQMTEVTDDDITAMSVGKVTRIDDDEDGSADGISMFGDAFCADPDMAVGHIALAAPVVNINYLFGSKPILPKLLGKSRDELERLTYFSSKLIVSSDDPEKYPVGSLLPLAEKETDSLKCLTGAEAILHLMQEKHVPNTGIVHTVIPVLPLYLRAAKVDCPIGKDAFYTFALQVPLNQVLIRSQQVEKVQALDVPKVLKYMQIKMLQDSVDCLINNGAHHGKVGTDIYGMPYYSMQETYRQITGISMKYYIPREHRDLDVSKVIEIVKAMSTTDYTGFCLIETGEPAVLEDDNGNWHDDIDRNDETAVALARDRYKVYKVQEKELMHLYRPYIRRFLSEQYPQYQQYFDVVENKILESLLELPGGQTNESCFIEDADLCISGISYLFFTNGLPFYQAQNDEQKKEEVVR